MRRLLSGCAYLSGSGSPPRRRRARSRRSSSASLVRGVLAAPPTHGFGLLAWLLPIFGLVGAGAVVGLVARDWTRVARREASSASPSSNGSVRLDPALERKLDEELARYDG